MDHESVQATALKIVFDLLHVYGFEAFNIVTSGAASNEKADETKDSSVDGALCEASVECVEGEDDDKASDTMQRLLNIMVSFLEGEVKGCHVICHVITVCM